MITRRQLLKAGAVGGAGLLVPWEAVGGAWAAIPGGSLDPTTIHKYAAPLVIPPVMPPLTGLPSQSVDRYAIAVRQFRQQILPPGMPATTVWGYGSAPHRGTFNYPAFTIEARADRPVRVKWINDLVDRNGRYLPHLLPVDPTLHWANPPGGTAGRDLRPAFTSTPGPYTGPVPIVTHLHGSHSAEESDGFAEAWYLPHASNIPAGYAEVGSFYDEFRAKFQGKWHQAWPPGTAVFQYQNDQRASTLWFHDHTLGMTRLNVYAGPAGFYLLRGGSADLPAGVLPGPAPRLGDPPGTSYYEIPIAVQDRSFNADGSLFYPASRKFFDDFGGPYIPGSDISPIFNPEFFGNTMVVNGRTWPVLAVEPRRYRLRFLNGCNSRFVVLKIVSDPLAPRPAEAAVSFWQVGTEGGFLPAPVQLDQLLMGLAERADVIVDFTGMPVGTQLYLINEGPDEPFGRGGLRGPGGGGAEGGAAWHPGRKRAPGPSGLGRSDHRASGAGGHRDLGAPQLHRGRPPHPHPRGAVPGREPPAVRAVPGTSPTAGALGDRLQGHRHRLPGGDHQDQGQVRPRRPVRVALPHRRARGQRDDAPLPGRAVTESERNPSRAGSSGRRVWHARAADRLPRVRHLNAHGRRWTPSSKR